MTDMFCSTHSAQAGEQLFGSAKPITTYFLLEFDGRWELEAFKDSAIPAPVKGWLQTALDTIPRSQALLIRQQPRRAPEGNAFFVALVRESNPVLYEFYPGSENDLLALDLPAVVAEDTAYAAFRRTEPLFLVCTHGRRDKCCARHGLPVYERLAQHVGAAVWQSSHMGGHRFAANMICLPHGIIYGRLTPDRAESIIDAYRAGRLVSEHYRGRACYPKVAQAAEYFLRAETGITELDAFQLVGTERTDGERWAVRFRSANGSATHTLLLAEDSLQTFANCGDMEVSVFSQYRLVT
jgi:hypothetical protein